MLGSRAGENRLLAFHPVVSSPSPAEQGLFHINLLCFALFALERPVCLGWNLKSRVRSPTQVTIHGSFNSFGSQFPQIQMETVIIPASEGLKGTFRTLYILISKNMLVK